MAVDMGSVDVFPATRIPKHLHRLCKPIYRSTSGMSIGSSKSTSNMKEKGFRVITDPATLSSVLQWAADEEVCLSYFLSIFELTHDLSISLSLPSYWMISARDWPLQ